jgi:hypothetical protein
VSDPILAARIEEQRAADVLERRVADRRRSPKVACPYCAEWDSIVTDSRPSNVGTRRRRKCQACLRTYSTIEVIDQDSIQKSA